MVDGNNLAWWQCHRVAYYKMEDKPFPVGAYFPPDTASSGNWKSQYLDYAMRSGYSVDGAIYYFGNH